MGRSHGSPQKWSWKSPPEVVMEVDPPRSGHGSGPPPPPEVVMEVDPPEVVMEVDPPEVVMEVDPPPPPEVVMEVDPHPHHQRAAKCLVFTL